LALSLFVFFAGNIPPLNVSEGGVSGPAIRAGGMFLGMLVLVWLLHRSRIASVVPALGVLIPLAPLLAFCFASVLWSQAREATIARSIETTMAVVYAALWAFLAVRLVGGERRAFNAIAAAIVMIAVQGLLMNLLIAGTPLRIVLLREGTDRLRLVFGFLHPLAVGDMLAIGILALCGGTLRLLSKAALGLPLFYLLVLTDSTGALLLTVTLGTALLVTNTRDARSLVVRSLLTLLAILVASMTIVVAHQDMLDRIAANQRLWSMTGRVQLWQAITNAGLADTWLGTGFDASRPAIDSAFGTAFNSHSAYLGVLVDLGYVGLVLFLVFMASFVWRLLRKPGALAWAFGLYCIGVGITNPLLLKANTLFPLILAYTWPAFVASGLGAIPKWSAPLAPKPTRGMQRPIDTLPGARTHAQRRASRLGYERAGDLEISRRS
jgi:O-antigen ligase